MKREQLEKVLNENVNVLIVLNTLSSHGGYSCGSTALKISKHTTQLTDDMLIADILYKGDYAYVVSMLHYDDVKVYIPYENIMFAFKGDNERC